MATVSDITTTALSGLNHIDALLDKGPDWNFFGNSTNNILYYTFSTASGNETGKTGQETFSAAQQAETRTAFTYLQQLTGIEFRETNDGTAAQIHLANMDLEGRNTTGLCSWLAGYRSLSNGTLTEYTANAYVYLDNNEWRSMNQNLTPGTQGYETLLHELGHALGLKHPFREGVADEIVLPSNEDNTSNTLMSYDQMGGWYSTYRPYDIAAFNWLYGGDGLRGALGINSTTGGRYITGSFKDEVLVGTAFNDTLQGNGGNDMIDGGAGIDTVVYNGNRNAYTFGTLADGALTVSGAEGTDTLRNIDWLQFADMTVERANVVVDTTAPAAPVLAVTQNGKDYATTGSVLLLNGSGEANSTVKVYLGEKLIATAQVDGTGLWSASTTESLPDGRNYQIFATATDAAGNVSQSSNQVLFHIDATAPAVPTLNIALAAGSNRPLFTGTGEAGTMIELYRDGDFVKIGSATVGGDGKWALASQPLPNGNYNITVVSLDDAGNARAGGQSIPMAVAHSGFQAGTSGPDTIVANAGSNAIDGGAGLDAVVYGGSRDAYAIKKETWGYTLTAPNGEVDGLFNVERIKFDDGWKAIDNVSAQIYRLYEAVLDRPAEEAGLGYWNWRMDNGTSLHQVATEFMIQPEFKRLYGENPTDREFIHELYRNVLDREPDTGGLLYWSQMIGQNGRAQMLIDFADSPENQAQVIDVVGKGLDFVPWQG